MQPLVDQGVSGCVGGGGSGCVVSVCVVRVWGVRGCWVWVWVLAVGGGFIRAEPGPPVGTN